MTNPALDAPISPLRQRLIDDMNMRRFSSETQRNYLRDIGRLATFLGPGRAAIVEPTAGQHQRFIGGIAKIHFHTTVMAHALWTASLTRREPVLRHRSII